MRTFSMMQEDMSPYMADLLTQLIAKLAAVSKVFSMQNYFWFIYF